MTQELTSPKPSRGEAEEAVRLILRYIGEDPTREGLVDTPRRYIDMFDELNEKREEEQHNTTFSIEGYNDLVVVRHIPLHSWCEHHLMSWAGDINIGYIPEGKVLGLSKFARIVTVLQSGLTVQETLTRDIADAVSVASESKDVAVISNATHSCMTARGARAEGSTTSVSVMLGKFRVENALRAEFLQVLSR